MVETSFAVTSCSTSPSAMMAEARERIAQHRQLAVFDHQLESAAEEEIPDQHRSLVAPDRVGGRRGRGADRAVVDDVVMQQGRGVNEFNGGGEGDVAIAAIARDSPPWRG